jgi:hypothetical protein
MIEAITAVAARASVDGPPPMAPSVNGSGANAFHDVMAGALQPPEGCCQCDARPLTAVQPAGSRVVPAPSSSMPITDATGLAAIAGRIGAPPVGRGGVATPAGATSSAVTDAGSSACGSGGLPSSIDDLVGVPLAISSLAESPFIGVQMADACRDRCQAALQSRQIPMMSTR